MFFREVISIVLISVAIVVGIIGYTTHFFLGDDNPIEESCEEIIKDTTGMDIDLTPGSPEKVNKTVTIETNKTAEDIIEEKEINQK